MADRTNKATGIKVISQVGHDPEANRYKRVKEEEERLRADLRKDSKIKRVKERGAHRSLSGGYLEGGDSDEEGVSLAALKNKYKKNRGSKIWKIVEKFRESNLEYDLLVNAFISRNFCPKNPHFETLYKHLLELISQKFSFFVSDKKQNYSSDEEDDSDVERKKSRKLEKAKNVLKDSDDSDGSARSRSPRRSRSRSR